MVEDGKGQDGGQALCVEGVVGTLFALLFFRECSRAKEKGIPVPNPR